MSEPFEVVRLVGKASLQISQHVKDGITEDFVRRRVLFALEDEKTYLRDGTYKLSYRVRKGKASHVSVEIYVREVAQ
ncbi:MAG: hypothetical protein QMD23_05355 [Candidatus Bathyarchaeia archaeon]|nr:hypothetical protein [Candidatus Bathyarchaeia archaeon]